MFLRQSTKEVEIINIHTAKGREWEKVILLVNPTMHNSLPDERNDLIEERRLFYVAVTRAKQELVVLNRGDYCGFISEFQNIPPPLISVDVELRFGLSDSVEIRYWFPRSGRDEIICNNNPLGVQRLQPSHLEKWFRPVIDHNSVFWTWRSRSPLLQTDETHPIVYTLGASDIWVFREDSERDGGWYSQRTMQLYENHLIVFRERFANQVTDCLRRTCEPEIEEPSYIYVDGKVNRWLYLRVKPIESVSFAGQSLWKLSVVSGKRISFIDGLSVKDRLGRRGYLDICLPTVVVPNLGLPIHEPLRIDGKEFPLNEDRCVTLHNVLEPGVYQLTYGGQKRELRIISSELSLEHHDRTCFAATFQGQAAIPTYFMKEIAEVSEESGLWVAGAKFFGTDISEVSWRDVEEIPELEPPKLKSSQSFKAPANIISSILKLAIDFKQGKVSVPEWFDEVLEHLDQNVALQALVKKKLNFYHKTALSYVELREQIGK